uniref:Diacylglycerol kinase n=1 Tax=Chlamydomonas leiostraca TaxID=1034604 RepID=A0A7S0RL32_9CHLO|mmetsp:Transcript_25668/g.65189  ORF Transcript_25668/g.65189 Transcript_25668/m.65189 type:complete len:595 (+) Transcript_25668:198-1982(+)
MAAEQAPAEVQAPAGASHAYAVYTQDDTLAAPYRIRGQYLRGLKEGVDAPPDSPLLVFINAKSGGRAGPALALALTRAVGRAQVYDLSEYRPDKVLAKLWDNLKEAEAGGDRAARVYRERLRVLVAGGDGTIAWVMGCIKALGLRPPPPVAIMPLGTGNDLARTFGWGHTFFQRWIKGYSGVYTSLMRITTARIDDLDCWRVRIRLPRRELHQSLPHSLQLVAAHHHAKHGAQAQQGASQAVPATIGEATTSGGGDAPVTAQGLFWNYFSVGLDAKSAHGFHSLREAHPALARGRLTNQFWYSFFSCTSGWFCCTKPLSAKVKLWVQVAGSDSLQELAIPPGVKALVVLNLQSYAGGRNLWGTSPTTKGEAAGESASRRLKEPAYNDGLLEVVGLTNGYHTAAIMATKGTPVHAMRLCQAAGIKLELRAQYSRPDGTPSHCYLQIDGEPWIQDVPSDKDASPITVEISHNGVSKVCHNTQGLAARLKSSPPPRAGTGGVGIHGGAGGGSTGRSHGAGGSAAGARHSGSGPKPPSPMSPSMMAGMQSGISLSGVTAGDSEAVHLGSERGPSSPSLHSTNLSLVSRSTTRRADEDA